MHAQLHIATVTITNIHTTKSITTMNIIITVETIFMNQIDSRRCSNILPEKLWNHERSLVVQHFNDIR